MPITVRYWAAAREASGVSEETLLARTVGELRMAIADRHGVGMTKILQVSSILVAGTLAHSESLPIEDGALADVLPPFAGG